MEKYYVSNNNTGNEYTILQAGAGNWCVYVDNLFKETETYLCFDTEKEAYAFVLGLEHGINPIEYEIECE